MSRDARNVLSTRCCDNDDPGHAHTQHITSVSLSSPTPLSLPKLRAWLQSLIDTDWQDLYRIKGILHIAGDARRFVVHGVHAELIGDFEDTTRSVPASPAVTPTAQASSDGVPQLGDEESRLVLIGKHLNHDKLQAGFLACIEAASSTATTTEDVSVQATPEAVKPVRQRRRVD